MADSFNYSLVLNEHGSYVLRSTVESFNLQQITDKDIISFYQNFSAYSVFDTGLLPLDGTGLLSIRSAGNHMQIAVQHKPGLYYINWGAHEGDYNAKTYFLAQPYRIVVGDFVDGNLLGARMFYSPVPITHPEAPLYHVNLPNINCKGYRGNGVGWICLYLKEDWSNVPFNEKVSRFIERCSGVETYNDANMSETDGPRFYRDHYNCDEDLAYLWDPARWQDKSTEEGYEWTLDPNIWIPVKVHSIDKQGQHDSNGIQLTFAGALLGNYQAYYTDNNIPKFYNVFARPDLSIKNDQIAKFVKKSFASSQVQHVHNPVNNPLLSSVVHREENSSTELKLQFHDPDSFWHCDCCENDFSNEDEEPIYDNYGNPLCSSCIQDHFVYVESVGEYFHVESNEIHYHDPHDCYYHVTHDTVQECPNCGEVNCAAGKKDFNITLQNGNILCPLCIKNYAEDNSLELYNCKCGSQTYIEETLPLTVVKYVDTHYNFETDSSEYSLAKIVYCPSCFMTDGINQQVCPCGFICEASDINKTIITPYNDCYVTAACGSCISNIKPLEEGILMGEYVPYDINKIKFAIENDVFITSKYVVPKAVEATNPDDNSVF